jgi:hypothetical protein
MHPRQQAIADKLNADLSPKEQIEMADKMAMREYVPEGWRKSLD